MANETLLTLAQFQLLPEEPTRPRGNGVWYVEIETALAQTQLQYDLIPLPFLYPGTNLVQKPPNIGYERLLRIRLLTGDDDSPYYFSNQDYTEFYNLENGDLEQAAAMACENLGRQDGNTTRETTHPTV